MDRLEELQLISTVVNKKDPDLPLTDEQIEEREKQQQQQQAKESASNDEKREDPFEMDQFYQDHDRISKELKILEGSIEELQRHNQLLLDCTDEEEQKKEEHQINLLVESVGKRSTSIRQEIEGIMSITEEMKKKAPKGSGDIRIRKSKTALLMKHFAEIVQRFHQVDTKARKDHQGLVERQYKTMRPEADEEEIAGITEAVGSMKLTTQQIFSLGSAQDPRLMLQKMHERRDEVMQIERGIVNLQRLFVDLNNIVEAQQEQLDSLEAYMGETVEYTEHAKQDMWRAVETQRNIRKMRCSIV